ncbi:MAG TPA: MG2 domain-containing protein, partial [Gemmatimonadales bacterium]|nr:MG2 domain-containing protein [Gemmatimonadales bacterium]
EKPLPLNCSAELVVPTVVDPEGTKPFARWAFSTYGPFSMVRAECNGSAQSCPTGGIRVFFTNPVKGAEVQRRLKVLPPVEFAISDTAQETNEWYLETTLATHTAYAVIADTGMRDVFGQRITGNPASGFRTTGFAPLVDHEYGRMTVERNGFGTLAVKHVNVDSLTITTAPVPDRLIPGMLQYSRWNRDDSTLALVLKGATTRTVAVPGVRDRVRIYGVKLPVYNALRPGAPVLQVVRVTSPELPASWQENQPFAVVQVTDLAVHAKIGTREGLVWVTGVSDGRARGGALVTLYDTRGRIRASGRTGADGTVKLSGFKADTTSEGYGFEGYVIARLGNDRALTSISSYDPDLSPWRFNVRQGYGKEREPVAAGVFTERGIYRPGEPLYAKAIVRAGNLGALALPARTDSIHWVFHDREGGILKEVVVPPSPFGTSDQTVTIPADAPLGYYGVSVEQRRGGKWVTLATTSYRVAEYRPPEFLVTVSSDSGPRFPSDSVEARVEARYLFGAPMARAAVTWVARQSTMDFWGLSIPNTDGFFFGENGWWWEDENRANTTQVLGQGVDTLDNAGRTAIRVGLLTPANGKPARATIEASVTDVNRQAVGSSTSFIVHPSSFYIGARPLGDSYFMTAGKPQSVAVIAVRPTGERVAGVKVTGTIVRKEWHRVHRTRGGYSEVYGEWVSDTVANCALTTTGAAPAECRFTPTGGGSYTIGFTAQDEKGRAVSTSVYRWATGSDWVPWSDESQFKMDVIADKSRYSVGDTATVMFASPFTDAEAWITVEREGVIEQRRMRLTSGSTTLKFPVSESWAPNAFVSIVVARGRSAKPGPLDDPGRPTIRVGYAELRVTPEVKRLAVTVKPQQGEYRPGDTAKVELKVTDRAGKGQRSEVTLWAVDEGVLALTGYKTPDPIDLLYAPRGIGLRLSSNLTTVAPQVPEGEKGRSPGGGGGAGDADVFRSQFKTTAFFLGSVVTDTAGTVVARARLPDNLTTFRVMAVAVTAGDRYGNGESPMLVTRPLLARPALPRFLREGDKFSAGVVVNQRAGGTPTVKVEASAEGAQLTGDATATAKLEAGRGREVRFDFRQPGVGPLGSDSATFRFKVTGAGDADAVQKRLDVKPAYRPRAWTASGVLKDTATTELVLPEGIDPERSRLILTAGASPLSIVKGLSWYLHVYPYYCSEQTSSAAQPIIALYRAQKSVKGVTLLQGDPRRDIELAVSLLSRRQRPDGGIGYWSASDWTTPWLSSYAGVTLLEAKSVGVAVDDSVLARLAEYLRNTLKSPQAVRAPVIGFYQQVQAQLSDQVAAADFLSRYGKPELPAENELLRNAAQLAWEDRIRLAEMLARRKAFKAARSLLEPTWAATRVEGRRAVVPEEAVTWHHYFDSRVRPTARLLTATLAVDSAHPLLGPLVETLVQRGRAGIAVDPWNTQDYAATVSALVAFDQVVKSGAGRGYTVASGGRTIFTRSGVPAAAPTPARLAMADSTLPLTGLMTDLGGGKQGLRLSLSAAGAGGPIYYYLTVSEVPKARPVNPEDKGIKIERWYEKYDAPTPIVSVAAGQLVRVRLRITVPASRQFVVVDDALPAGLEAVDLSLRTASLAPGPGLDQKSPYLSPEQAENDEGEGNGESTAEEAWYYGSWDSGWWSPFDHKEMGDSRVLYSATVLWQGTYTMTYIARATTPGIFVRPPAHAEEMYNPAVYGRSDGGVFTVTEK